MTDNTDNQGRRGQWFSLAAFTTIALASFVNDMSGDLTDQRKEMKWSFSALVMSLAFAFMSMVASLVLRERFSGTPMEHGMVRPFTPTFSMRSENAVLTRLISIGRLCSSDPGRWSFYDYATRRGYRD